MKRELAILAGAAVLALALCEASLRLLKPQSLMTPAYEDRDGMRVFRPNALIKHSTPWFNAVYATNGLGFRGPVYAERKGSGVYRIVVLGPSFTFGIGVNEGETYARRLEERLNAADPSRRYQVMNFGWPGIPLNAYAPFYRGALSRYEPDLLLIHIQIDTLGRATLTPIKDFHGGDPTSSVQVVGLRRWLRRLRLVPGYSFLCENSHAWAVLRLRAAANLDQAGVEQVGREAEEDAGALQRLWNSTFDALVADAGGRPGALRVLATVDAASLAARPIIRKHLEAKSAADPRFKLIELSFGPDDFYIGEGHWNRRGHELVAQALSSFLARGKR